MEDGDGEREGGREWKDRLATLFVDVARIGLKAVADLDMTKRVFKRCTSEGEPQGKMRSLEPVSITSTRRRAAQNNSESNQSH